MPGLSAGLNLALNALLAHQQAIEVIEHNVANANTPGYHRQEAMLAAGLAYPSPRLAGGTYPGQMGTGVMVTQIRRFNLEFYDTRLRRESAEAKGWETAAQALTQVETMMAENTTDGLLPKLNAFFNGWQALSDDPANMALRADLVERSKALADGFQSRAVNLTALRKDQDLAIRERVNEVNGLTTQVARLNTEIANVKAAGDAPNDLLDQRDQMLNRLSELTGATVNFQENGEALVAVNGHALVFSSTAYQLEVKLDADNMGWPAFKEDGQALQVSRGELFGIKDVRDRVIPQQLADLNTLAYELATQVNTQHQTGFGLTPGDTTHRNFFDAIPGPPAPTNAALLFKVSSAMDDLRNVAAGTASDAPGDSSNAIALAKLKDQPLMNGGVSTFHQYYTGKVGQLGLEVSTAGTKARDRALVAASMEKLKESAVGVNLDEEAANLMKAQRAFQAATRLVNVMDEMLDRVINGMGVVGR
jgi:flagellar hook-associated protein 1 FlgK